MQTNQRKEYITQKFTEQYHRAPTIWARAPGRVDLMGSHTDYNLGYVMTMTIDRDTWIAAAPRSDMQVHVYSLNLESSTQFDQNDLFFDHETPWSNYLRGMAAVLRQAGYPLRGWDGIIHSTIPFASGLSSSAALEMATGVIYQAVGGFNLDGVRLARLGQKAENQFVGVNCGILDQYSSAMGRAESALLLDCRSLTSQLTPISPDVTVVICDTRAKRSLAGTEYGERRAQCEEGVQILQQFYPHIAALRDVTPAMLATHQQELPSVVAKRCRFIIEENQRVLDLAGALAMADRPRLAELTAQSYAGARDLYEIGAPSMQAMISAALNSPGIIGVRQAGAGFGGCMVALVESTSVESFCAAANAGYQKAVGIDAHIYPVQAADGAMAF